MKKQVLLLSLIIFFTSIHLTTYLAMGISVSFKVTRVVWGEDPDSPIKIYPGDSEVSLIMEVQNLSPDRIVKGVYGTIFLENCPFKDIYGNYEVISTGEPVIGDILEPTDEIKAKGFFTLSYTLDIDEDAVPSSYSCNLVIEYSVEETPGSNETRFVDGSPQTLIVNLVVSKFESVIEVSVSPEIIEIGESVRVSGSINPSKEDSEVKLIFRKPNGSSFSSYVLTNVDGTFSYNIITDVEGFWSVNASWIGDLKFEGDSVASSFEVRLPHDINIVTSNQRIVGGLDNPFNITIQNSGEISISGVEVAFEIPQPLVIHGETTWKINYIEKGSFYSIHLTVFAPATSIGSTYSGSLTINYRDDYNENHDETITIGFIVVGRIELEISDKRANPQLVRNGSKLEVIMTLLNKGNIAAMYVNASILPSSPLYLTKESSVYIGEVEENSPNPFTLIAYVNSDVENGTYPIMVKIYFRDDQYSDHSLTETLHITVVSLREIPTDSNNEGVWGFLFSSWMVLSIVVISSLTIMLLYKRQSNKRRPLKRLGEEA